MIPPEFVQLARTYGGRLNRWPADRQAAAERLLELSPELLDVLHAQRRLDDALATARIPIAEARVAQLIEKVVTAARQQDYGQPVPRVVELPVTARARRAVRENVTSIAAGLLVALGIASTLLTLSPPPVRLSRTEPKPDVLTTILNYEGFTLMGGDE